MDNRIEAKKRIKELLRTDLGYIYKETNVGRHKIHLTFKMDSRTHELQMTFDFAKKYCDILTFISPRVLTDEYYDETLYTINTINWKCKKGHMWEAVVKERTKIRGNRCPECRK